MANDRAPGVYRQDIFPTPAPSFLTGVPAFLGYAATGPIGQPQLLTLWPQFAAQFGPAAEGGYLAYAVRGFFENDGLLCYVVRLDDTASAVEALRRGLATLGDLDDADLVCAPDIMRTAGPASDPDPDAVAALQAEVLHFCRREGNRFAILDGLPSVDTAVVMRQRAKLAGEDGALYYPWLWAPGNNAQLQYLPPCGHVAGAFSRSDQQVGVHKAPANQAIEGVLDLRANLDDQAIGVLYGQAINCLRAFPGRGFRVWGARTLSDDPAWQYVNARRVFLTASRWIERFMTDLVQEPNDIRLWVRIMRELTAYLDELYQRGALKGRTPAEAFFVKCDNETNTQATIDAGIVVTQVGLALAAPAEFVIVRIIHGASGVAIAA